MRGVGLLPGGAVRAAVLVHEDCHDAGEGCARRARRRHTRSGALVGLHWRLYARHGLLLVKEADVGRGRGPHRVLRSHQ